MLGIEALNLFNARASVLGEVEDVDLAVGEDDAHADGGMAQAVDAALRLRDGIVLETGLLQQLVELTLDGKRSRAVLSNPMPSA